jgi:L-alanine-DL-glutamate epimerase-like enolase superfamily enzyme
MRSGLKNSIHDAADPLLDTMRIERIEISHGPDHATATAAVDRCLRHWRTGRADRQTGAGWVLAEGLVGYGQIRPLAPHHSMPDTYASMIAMIRDVCGSKLIGQRVFDLESIHALFDRLAPANYMARTVLDVALHDAMGKAVRRPVYDLIGGLAQPLIPLEW